MADTGAGPVDDTGHSVGLEEHVPQQQVAVDERPVTRRLGQGGQSGFGGVEQRRAAVALAQAVTATPTERCPDATGRPVSPVSPGALGLRPTNPTPANPSARPLDSDKHLGRGIIRAEFSGELWPRSAAFSASEWSLHRPLQGLRG